MLTPRRDEGFTLVELLITVAVLGIVMGGLVAVMIGVVSTDVKTRMRLDETRAEAFAAVYFGTDAQSATSMLSGGAAGCGTGTAVIEFRGVSYTPTTRIPEPTVTVISYVFSATTGQLTRQSCEATGTPTYPLAVTTSTTVARSLGSAPTAACAPTACSATTPNTTSTTVTLSVARRSGDAPFQLVGTRRTTV